MKLEPVVNTELLVAKHGFFTRHGGVSTGVFSSLNCAYGSPEPREVIEQNRVLIAAHFDIAPQQLYSVTQTHSADVITLNTPNDFVAGTKADAMVSKSKGIALGVLTADCAPVLFEDAQNGVVGAAHAGWRGAFGGVLEATIAAMENIGAKRTNIHAVIGPCISQQNYEVGLEFFEDFIVEDQAHAQFFTNGTGTKYLFDLPRFTLSRLRNAGIAEAAWTGPCTYANPETYFSYRYAQHNGFPSYGRMLSVITA